MNNAFSAVKIAGILVSVMLSTSVAAQTLSDNELFEQGRQAYLSGKFVDAAMKLYAYKVRDPIAFQLDPNHLAEVEQAIAFCREQPEMTANKLRTDLDTCRSELYQLADECDKQVVASTSSYVIRRPQLNQLSESASHPKAYPLVCRGGGSLKLAFYNQKRHGVQNALMLSFRKGNQGVGNNNSVLGPGSCSWKDRGMRNGEPNALCFAFEKRTFSVSWSISKPLTKVQAPYLPRKVQNLSDESNYAVFQVYNNNEGCLVVTRAVLRRVVPRAPLQLQTQ